MILPSPSALARTPRLLASPRACSSASRPRPTKRATSSAPFVARSTASSSSSLFTSSSSCLACQSPSSSLRQIRSFHRTAKVNETTAKVNETQFSQIAKIAEARAKERVDLMASVSEEDSQSDSVSKSKRLRVLEPLAEAWKEYQDLEEAIADSLPLLKDPDPSMREMASSEIKSLRSSLNVLLSTTLPTLLLPPSTESELSCIVELKSGSGGDEAALFASELMAMYIRYASLQGWKVSIMEESRMGNASEGLRDAQLEIKGAGAYGKLRWESGVHRVQRVPATEKAGRTHTSTMAVMVMPISENVDVDDLSYIDEKDVKMEFYRSSGAGGQHVNKTESAVRLTHLPTKLSVGCQQGRSQHANRSLAWTMLRAKIYAQRLAQKLEKDRIERKSQIPGMERGDKIRTWNFPQDRVTDHRKPISMSNLPSIISGDTLDDLLYEIGEYHLGLRLEAMLGGDEYDG